MPWGSVPPKQQLECAQRGPGVGVEPDRARRRAQDRVDDTGTCGAGRQAVAVRPHVPLPRAEHHAELPGPVGHQLGRRTMSSGAGDPVAEGLERFGQQRSPHRLGRRGPDAGDDHAGEREAGVPTFTGPAFTGPAFTGPAFTGPAFTGPARWRQGRGGRPRPAGNGRRRRRRWLPASMPRPSRRPWPRRGDRRA